MKGSDRKRDFWVFFKMTGLLASTRSRQSSAVAVLPAPTFLTTRYLEVSRVAPFPSSSESDSVKRSLASLSVVRSPSPPSK